MFEDVIIPCGIGLAFFLVGVVIGFLRSDGIDDDYSE